MLGRRLKLAPLGRDTAETFHLLHIDVDISHQRKMADMPLSRDSDDNNKYRCQFLSKARQYLLLFCKICSWKRRILLEITLFCVVYLEENEIDSIQDPDCSLWMNQSAPRTFASFSSSQGTNGFWKLTLLTVETKYCSDLHMEEWIINRALVAWTKIRGACCVDHPRISYAVRMLQHRLHDKTTPLLGLDALWWHRVLL